MPLLAALGALAIILIAGAFAFVLLRARALRARHRRIVAQPVPPLDSLGLAGERSYASDAALFHGSRFADGTSLLLTALSTPCVGDLWCSNAALFLRREAGAPEEQTQPILAWPLAWIDEASLHRGFAPLAGKELPLLRLRWHRGGESLISELSVRGGMEQLERLRREIHLRQERGAVLVQLGALRASTPEEILARSKAPRQ